MCLDHDYTTVMYVGKYIYIYTVSFLLTDAQHHYIQRDEFCRHCEDVL